MKTPLPSKVEEFPTHAHWVAAYWSKALTQLATQGHTYYQAISVEQLLTQFLNINRVCIETTQKTGWHTEHEMWLSAVEATRRKDVEFDLAEHFRKITPEHLKEGKQSLETSYKSGTTSRNTGRGWGASSSATTTPADMQVVSGYTPDGGKGKYKTWPRDYPALEYARAPGKYYGKLGKMQFPLKGAAYKGKLGGKPWAKGKLKAKAQKM